MSPVLDGWFRGAARTVRVLSATGGTASGSTTPLEQIMTDSDNTHGTPANDPEGTEKPGGLGDDSTIPNNPDGLAAGHTGDGSHFNPEEDGEQ